MYKRIMFWPDYYWNRFLCLFGLHLVWPLPVDFASDPTEIDRPICAVCERWMD